MSEDVTIARDVNIDEHGDPINWRHNERVGGTDDQPVFRIT